MKINTIGVGTSVTLAPAGGANCYMENGGMLLRQEAGLVTLQNMDKEVFLYYIKQL
jgi:hypothetical protein